MISVVQDSAAAYVGGSGSSLPMRLTSDVGGSDSHLKTFLGLEGLLPRRLTHIASVMLLSWLLSMRSPPQGYLTVTTAWQLAFKGRGTQETRAGAELPFLT